MNYQDAFDLLLKQVNAAIEESLTRYTVALQRGDLDAKQVESEKQENLIDSRRQLEILKDMWSDLVGERNVLRDQKSGGRPARAGSQALNGRITPREAYVVPILVALDEKGGKGDSAQVVRRVGELLADRLTDHDRGLLKTGGIRWQNYARWARQSMKEQGLLRSDSPVGIWEMTDKGRAYLREHAGEASKLRTRKP